MIEISLLNYSYKLIPEQGPFLEDCRNSNQEIYNTRMSKSSDKCVP